MEDIQGFLRTLKTEIYDVIWIRFLVKQKLKSEICSGEMLAIPGHLVFFTMSADFNFAYEIGCASSASIIDNLLWM